MSEYAWIIDVDHFPDLGYEEGTFCNAKDLVGPDSAPYGLVEILASGGGKRFRLYDDDGELYYSGRYLGPDDETEFAPLDDFGGPNSGCTEIAYCVNGKWVML